jgi:hypothetical protein
MDHRNVLLAAGLPFEFDRYEAGGATVEGAVPGGRRTFTIPQAVPAESG